MKGRPPLAPRIEDLEKRTEELLSIVVRLEARIRQLEEAKPKAYEPIFDRWPGLR